MKVQVNVKVISLKDAVDFATLDLFINEADTVLCVKERISAAQLIAFPEQDLVLDGETLDNGCQIVDCGVKEGSSMDFVVKASEETLVQQLKELLQARDLTSDELGLLYCYKQGVSMNQSLKLLGYNGKFVDFVKSKKCFMVENGRVTLVREDTAMKPFSLVDEVKHILEASPSGSMEIPTLCAKFVQKFNISLESVAGMRPTDFIAKEKGAFSMTGRRLVSLRGAVPINNHSAPQEVSAGGRNNVAVPSTPDDGSAEEYLELHNKICSRSFNSRAVQALSDVVEAIKETTFLNIHHVVKTGSVGKGTAISGVMDAELVLYVNSLPPCGHNQWLPGLLKATAGALQESTGLEDIHVDGDCVALKSKDLDSVQIRVSPVYDSYGKVLQLLGQQRPSERCHTFTSLAEEKTRFVEKQPSAVKMTMRLMKWWREQQQWSSAQTQPSDEMLELIVIYSAMQSKPANQRLACANVLSLLSRFDELRIVWPATHYSKDEIWAPLLHQCPLLMDPTNPFVNVADSQGFDSRELMSLAKSTHFFW